MMRELSAVMIIILLAGSPAALATDQPAEGRSDSSNRPPFADATIPDFSVRVGTVNNMTNNLDLLEYFSDPDLPPAGNDSLHFHVVDTGFPATIAGSRLVFGPAPDLQRLNETFLVLVLADDSSGSEASMIITVFVYGGVPPPPFRRDIEIRKDEVAYVNLNRLFPPPYDDFRNITYVGGASDNLTVEIVPNGTAAIMPATAYVSDGDLLRFRMPSPNWTYVYTDLAVRIRSSFDTIYCRWDLVWPDPTRNIIGDENETLFLDVRGAISYDNASRLYYIWYLDGAGKEGALDPMLNWTPDFNASGQHKIKCRIRDQLDHDEIEWNITIRDVNRPPVIEFFSPADRSNYTYNTKILFQANASDPDWDALTFHWRLPGGLLLRTDTGKNTSAFSRVLPAGNQIIMLEVEDGHGGYANRSVFIHVYPRPEPEPDRPCLALLWLIAPFSIAASFVVAIMAWARWKR
jgi:hypothetical protein